MFICLKEINNIQDNIKKVYQQSAYCNEMLKRLICGLQWHLKPFGTNIYGMHSICIGLDIHNTTLKP